MFSYVLHNKVSPDEHILMTNRWTQVDQYSRFAWWSLQYERSSSFKILEWWSSQDARPMTVTLKIYSNKLPFSSTRMSIGSQTYTVTYCIPCFSHPATIHRLWTSWKLWRSVIAICIKFKNITTSFFPRHPIIHFCQCDGLYLYLNPRAD